MVSKNIENHFSIPWKITGIYSLFQEYLAAFKTSESSYYVWRDRFMKAGLFLGIAIASTCIITFTILLFSQNPITLRFWVYRT
ncbi:MAG: hypothetical protein F6K03_15475 [Kamptonema sp. SIO4C4]|nr:hypothetical protein [Kamptonema sp. SIO4C4]